jgi:MFS family permease
MIGYGLFAIALIIPLALLFLHEPPEVVAVTPGSAGEAATPKVFGWPPNVVFAMLAIAAFLCCVTMSMPQAHLVAFCSDLGITPTHGAAMLSVLLGVGFLSRQGWGAISDRIGGLLTLLISSVLQAAGLFAVAGAFGIGFSALIPAYVLAIREYFPAREASWRVPALLLLSGSGMATGTWLAGIIYDHYGYYAPAFAAGVGFNLLNLAAIGTLVLRRRFAR